MLVNLGCGPNGIDGWVNYDWGLLPILNKFGLVKVIVSFGIVHKNYDRRWPNFKLADLRKPLPIEGRSVDWVYCSHVIEHLEKYEAIELVREIKRILKNNGKVRIVLPDLQRLIKLYACDPDEFNRKYFGFEKDKKIGILGRFIRPHNWMYTPETFKEILTEAGFIKINISSFRKSKMPDIKKLDLKLHKELSFYIEAGN